jgi:FkbM family methyltransferase
VRHFVTRLILTIFEPLRIACLVAGDMRSFFELLYVFSLAYVNRQKNFVRRTLLCDLPGLVLTSAQGAPLVVKLKCNRRVFDVLFPATAATEFWSIRSTITEVLIKEVYRPQHTAVDIAIDAGANYGLATLYLSTFFPNAEFICFEPSSETYKILTRNLEQNSVRFRAFQKALSNFDGWVRFEVGRSSMERAISKDLDVQQAETVACTSLRSEVQRLGIRKVDFLKVDVEGQEVRLLEGLGDDLKGVAEIIAEAHDSGLAEEMRRLLVQAGFEVSEHDEHVRAARPGLWQVPACE